jgi:hypothetical protein
MRRTVPIKIELPKEFLTYLETCSIIFNRYVDWCFNQNSYNKIKAHKELYNIFREEYSSVPSAIIQTIRDMALEAVKVLKFKFKPIKKPYSHIRYNKLSISLKGMYNGKIS